MGKQRLTISVIIPTYNRAELVCVAVDSLLAQTRVPDEIIVVDDGSTDHTLEALKQYRAPVKVIYQPNAGRSAARNRGLDEAQGELIAFLDSDDYLLPESIARRAEVLERRPEIGAVYADLMLVNSQRQELGLYSHFYPTPRPSGIIFAELARRNILLILAPMFRRPAGPLRFDTTLDLAEDYDFWLRLAVGCTFHYLDQPLAAVRMPEGVTLSASTWELPGESAENNWLGMKKSEINVQARAISTGAFRQLSRLQRARILCAHGMRHRMIGQNRHARQLFLRAVWLAPYYPTGYGLLILNMLGSGVFRWAVHMRRRVIRLMEKLK